MTTPVRQPVHAKDYMSYTFKDNNDHAYIGKKETKNVYMCKSYINITIATETKNCRQI